MGGPRRGRNILFVTTDQQRYDALGCNGGTVARTPVIDGLAARGLAYDRAHPPNVVCMPSRSTMITGQSVGTHGVWMNGVPLPPDAPSIAAHLAVEGGYRTALFGKAHFEPFLDPAGQFYENTMASAGEFGPHRGFEHLELAAHTAFGRLHYAQWMRAEHPALLADGYPILDGRLQVNALGGGDTGAPQVHVNPMPRDCYHTDWVADRAIAWLAGLPNDDDWFCWVSFPDPHHPWDPPAAERRRVDWRDLDLPIGYPQTASEREAILDGKPRHWKDWYLGRGHANYEAPADWVPATLTATQVQEVNALTHVENELIDEAIGRVLAHVAVRGWERDTDVVYTTDHGELQGDFGLLFKGPYHVDALMRLPLVWAPAPVAAVAPARISAPVGLVDLAATFCAIAGVAVPPWVEGEALPTAPDEPHRPYVLTEWDSVHANGDMHVRTITRDGWICTTYGAGTFHDGSEGELYALTDDPLQRRNLWDDPAYTGMRRDLVADLVDHQPVATSPNRLPVAPV